MKKIAASIGLLAVGVSALHAAESSTLNSYQKTKAWSVSATLRGFYDDNIAAAPSGSETESVGIQITPEIDYGYAGEQTSFNLGYAFTARYFDKQAPGRADKSDYTHTFNADLSHVFNPRLDMRLSEAFVIGQEPDLLRDPASTQPIDGDNIRNFANIDFNIEATQLLGFAVGYQNAFYDYDDEGGTALNPSNSGLLDRVEHSVHIDSRWRLSPATVGIVGYMFSQANYTGDEFIALPAVVSENRDSRGHTLYVGAEQIFSPTLSGSVKMGGQRYNYFNDPADEAQWSPYVQGSLRYLYQTTTSADIGVSYSRAAANSGGAGTFTFIRDTEVAVVYGSLKHELMDKLVGTASVNLQHSTYNAPGSTLDGEGYLYYQLGLDLSYQFTQNLSGHVGYNYDKMESDIQNSDYDRNRIYLGVTAGF